METSSGKKDFELFRRNVVEPNFFELEEFIKELSTNFEGREEVLATRTQKLDTRDRLEANKKFSRLLYNYLTSAFSLVDQMDRSETSKNEEEFMEKKQVSFLKELRNYFIHSSRPSVDSEEMGAEVLEWKKRKFLIKLDTGFLEELEGRGRENKVRNYLNQKTEIDAELELRRFHNSLMEFYRENQKSLNK